MDDCTEQEVILAVSRAVAAMDRDQLKRLVNDWLKEDE